MACFTVAPLRAAPAPAISSSTWATPVEAAGLPNLHRVDATYYRGAQPTKEGFASLDKIGIKTVINLRTSTTDRWKTKGTKLSTEHIWFKTWHPEPEDVDRFLTIATDPARQPIFVHCRYGADRTGMMTAIYRMVVQGWSREDAIAEMTQGGFGFHPEWENLVTFLQHFDVDAARQRLHRAKGVSIP